MTIKNGEDSAGFFSGNIKIFWDLVFAYTKERIERLNKNPDYRKGLEKSISDSLWGRGPTVIEGIEHTKLDLFISNKLFKPFSEISESFENIQNIRVYINSFPFRRSNISKASYLRYHIENYLNEIYILKERLIVFSKIIDRAYKTSPEYPSIYKIVDLLPTYVEKSLKPYIDIRGFHMHQYRYSDEDVSRMVSLDLLLKGTDDDFSAAVKVIYKIAYSEIKRKWRKKLSSDIAAIRALIDIYFEYLLKALEVDGNLLLPVDIRNSDKKETTAGK